MTAKTPTVVQVPLLDLKIQYAALREEIDEAIRAVVESQYFILGPTVQRFEEAFAAYAGKKHAIGCASGSDALLLALMALDIGPGDEVICPSYTFFATGGAIARLGATPVFADIEPDTYNVDPAHVRALAAKCTRLKAIMPVHLYGRAANLDALAGIAGEFEVPIIEDSAQAVGARDARGEMVGLHTAFSCYSFFPSKNLGGFGDGGLISSPHDELAEKVRLLRNHGMNPKYYYSMVGVNSRLDALQAAVLEVKLRHLESWHDGRGENAAMYDRLFAQAGALTSTTPLDAEPDALPLRTPTPAPKPMRHIYNQYVIRVPAEHRDPLRAHLQEGGVGTEVYYPVPLHMQECFAHLPGGAGDLPHSEAAALETIALPIFPELTDEQIEHVAATVISYLHDHAGS